jgi:hypothetical protein
MNNGTEEIVSHTIQRGVNPVHKTHAASKCVRELAMRSNRLVGLCSYGGELELRAAR